MKRAVILYGIVQRSLAFTHGSLREHVLDPLGAGGAEVSIFYHSWEVGSIHNPRAEEEAALDPGIVSAYLPEARGIFECQEAFDDTMDWEKLLSQNAMWRESGPKNAVLATLMNYRRAMESLRRAWSFFEARADDYDIVVVARPDVRFLNAIPVVESRESWIWVPQFHAWGGVNDRFAMGGEREMKLYCNRATFVEQAIMSGRAANSEQILESWLESNDIHVERIDFVFQRVRADGSVPRLDRHLCPAYQSLKVAPVTLPEDGTFELRRAPRPVQFRQSFYEERFDASTLVYDVFAHASGKVVIGVSPPMLNLQPWFESCRIVANGRPCESEYWEMDRCGLVMVDCSGALPECLEIISGRGRFEMPVGANHCRAFQGRRVLLTKSKNNRLEWIRDWVDFHVQHHGADAVLLYDNGSTEYTLGDVLETIRGVKGVRVGAVVDWPFSFGPGGFGAKWWDSDFCQHGALEHARWRFLLMARSVLSCDVDELVVTGNGKSVFDVCESSETGFVSFHGRWAVCCDAPGEGREPVRHQDHRHYALPLGRCPRKWAAVPHRIPEDCQWKVHGIDGFEGGAPWEKLQYLHCQGISTSWKRDRPAREPFSAEHHQLIEDVVLPESARNA